MLANGEDDTTAPSPSGLLLVFEGGGAKGVTHVGALAAIEARWPRCRRLAFAGTSAGAIVAALAAAGWKARDMIDETGASRALDAAFTARERVGGRARATMLVDRWLQLRRLALAKEAAARFWPIFAALAAALALRSVERTDALAAALTIGGALLGMPALLAAVLEDARALRALPPSSAKGPALRRRAEASRVGALAAGALATAALAPDPWPLVGLALAGFGAAVVAAPARRGVSDPTRAFVGRLDRALASGLGLDTELPGRPLVTFRQLWETRGVALRVIATDFATGELRTFSERRTPEASVALAVAASGAIPVAFRPVTAPVGPDDPAPRAFVDGGLVSNLPVWVIDDLRESEPDALTIVSTIGKEGDRPASPETAGLRAWLRLAHSTIFGARLLETRGATHNVRMLRTPTGLGVLDFDATRAEAARARDDAALSAAAQIETLDAADELMRRVLGDLIGAFFAGFGDAIGAGLPIDASSDEVARALRAHIASSSFDEEITRVVASSVAPGSGMVDDRLSLPNGRSLAARALARGAPAFAALAAGPGAFGDPVADRYRASLVWPEIGWAIATPLSVAFGVGSPLRDRLLHAVSNRETFATFDATVKRSALLIDGRGPFAAAEAWTAAVPPDACALLSLFAESAVIALAFRQLSIDDLDTTIFLND